MKVQLVIVALLVGVTLGDRGGDRGRGDDRGGRGRGFGGPPPVPTALANWVQLREYVNVSIIVEPSVYASSINPAFSQLQPLLSQAGVQVSDVANGKKITVSGLFAGDMVPFLMNAQNDTNSAVTIVDQGSTDSFTRAATEFLLQAVASQRTLAAKLPTKSNLQQLFRGFGNVLGERMERIVQTALSPLQNLP